MKRETTDLNTKPIRVMHDWTYRGSTLTGVIRGHLFDISSIIDVVKDSEDTYIIEVEDAFIVLQPPAYGLSFDKLIEGATE